MEKIVFFYKLFIFLVFGNIYGLVISKIKSLSKIEFITLSILHISFFALLVLYYCVKSEFLLYSLGFLFFIASVYICYLFFKTIRFNNFKKEISGIIAFLILALISLISYGIYYLLNLDSIFS